MKKETWNAAGTKMIIDSGWKEFDRQTNLFATGNVYANTQYSSFIRPWKQTECNGFTNPEGHLMDFDLKAYDRWHMPQDIEDYLKDKEREDSVILYMFFIVNKENHVEPFCWAITDKDYHLVMHCIQRGYKQSYQRRLRAAAEALSYVTQ